MWYKFYDKTNFNILMLNIFLIQSSWWFSHRKVVYILLLNIHNKKNEITVYLIFLHCSSHRICITHIFCIFMHITIESCLLHLLFNWQSQLFCQRAGHLPWMSFISSVHCLIDAVVLCIFISIRMGHYGEWCNKWPT